MGNFLTSKGFHFGTRKWHGSIMDKFSCIDNLVTSVTKHQAQWAMPPDLYDALVDGRRRLWDLISKCQSTSASADDRMRRNALFRSMTDLCLSKVKIWAIAKFSDGAMSASEVHLLGFLLPGETGGHHGRKEPTDILAEVKVSVINADFIRVIVDQASGDAAKYAHGWPAGVRYALVVITAVDGHTEVYHRLTSRQRHDVHLPAGSHGKQFVIKAAFLVHVDDEPNFGPGQTFSMPLTTEDLFVR
jgi:hypothetical protein